MKIAILDDDEPIRITISLLLEQIGHIPKAFATEEELFLGLETFKADVVILDQMLGGKRTGLQLVKDLRERYSELPIVVVSGYPQLEINQAVKQNDVTFLTKPFSLAALQEQISKYSSD